MTAAKGAAASESKRLPSCAMKIIVDNKLTNHPKRGFFLTTFLILIIIVNFLSAIANMFVPEILQNYFNQSTKPNWEYIARGIWMFANVVFGLAMWRWLKWGIYGFCISALFSFFLNIVMGVAIYKTVAGLFGAVLLLVLAKPAWNYFS